VRKAVREGTETLAAFDRLRPGFRLRYASLPMNGVPVGVRGIPPLAQKQARAKDGAPNLCGASGPFISGRHSPWRVKLLRMTVHLGGGMREGQGHRGDAAGGVRVAGLEGHVCGSAVYLVHKDLDLKGLDMEGLGLAPHG
jgi:hypothetical protein